MCDNPSNIWTPDNYDSDRETIPRGLYRGDLQHDDYTRPKDLEFVALTTEPVKIARAILSGNPPNLIGSMVHPVTEWERKELKGGHEFHAPMLDLDGSYEDVRIKKSSTRNHHHILWEHEIRKEHYEKWLETGRAAGIVQYGWVNQMETYGQTFLRWNALKDKVQ